MSFDLFVWKGPIPQTGDEAADMVEAHYDRDQSVFLPSDDLAKFHRAVLARWPSVDGLSDGGRLSAVMLPWSFPDRVPDQIMEINLPFEVKPDVLADLLALAREHGLVVYDPQGPTVYAHQESGPNRGRPWMLAGSVGLAYGGLFLFAGLVFFGSTIGWLMIGVGIVVLGISVVALRRDQAKLTDR
jgi:hypothetical protein